MRGCLSASAAASEPSPDFSRLVTRTIRPPRPPAVRVNPWSAGSVSAARETATGEAMNKKPAVRDSKQALKEKVEFTFSCPILPGLQSGEGCDDAPMHFMAIRDSLAARCQMNLGLLIAFSRGSGPGGAFWCGSSFLPSRKRFEPMGIFNRQRVAAAQPPDGLLSKARRGGGWRSWDSAKIAVVGMDAESFVQLFNEFMLALANKATIFAASRILVHDGSS